LPYKGSETLQAYNDTIRRKEDLPGFYNAFKGVNFYMVDQLNNALKNELLALHQKDQGVREELARDGSLFEGYHHKMQEVHDRNAERLEQIINQYGWPGKSLVGEDAAHSAWIILQHAIAKPALQRKLLPILQDLAQKGEVDKAEVAMLEDRILYFEGKAQIYGTQFDWDENGQMSPLPIENADEVDECRKRIGLPPLEETTRRHRENIAQTNEKPPKDFEKRKKQFEEWATTVGWRG
jgi:hypothetical protein